MWRPEGWENPYEALEYMSDGKLISLAYEIGADAMYKALKEWQEEDCTEHSNTFPMRRMDCLYCQDELWN